MTDLFRGYDLTTVVEKVAQKHYERTIESIKQVQQNDEAQRIAEGQGMEPANTPQYYAWEDLSPVDKRNFKESVLPLITDVLDALESDQVKPTEAKQMYEYPYLNAGVDRHDPRFYENVDIMHDVKTSTVWALHLNIHPKCKDAVLERMSILPEPTGEYTYGDSWTEWGEGTSDDADRHLTIYFDATPAKAAAIGYHLANHATFAAMQVLGGDNATIPPYAVSTAGDYAEQIPNL